MNTFGRLGNYFFVIFSVSVYAIPPEVCYANFRWDDCGKPPVPVMYYWKPGSRCEVAMWRGCLPNPNMFPDEYSCINTCIFVQRADNYNMGLLSGDENEQIIEISEADEPTQTEDNDAEDVTAQNEDSGSNSTGGVSDGGTDVTTLDGLVTGDGNSTADGTGDASNNTIEGAS